MNQISTSFSQLENSSEYLCGITDRELRFIHANHLFQKQFDLSKEEWKGKPFHEVVESFHLDKCLQAKENCISNPDKVICIEIQTRHHVDEHWFRWEVAAIKDESGDVLGIRFIGTDITRQKKAEQELLRQAVLFDSISDAVISTDLQFNIKSWNLSAEVLFGIKAIHSNNIPVTEYFSIYAADEKNSEVRKKIFDNGFWKGELVVIKKDGTRMLMQSSVSLIRDVTGLPIGFVGINRDITEEKKAKEDLIYKKEQFKSFMENLPALSWINGEDGTLYYMNSIFKNVFKLDNKAIGSNVFDLYPEEMRENCKASDQLVLSGNKSVEVFEEGKDEKGNKIFYQVHKFPIHNKGVKLIGGLAIDITAQTISRQELVREKNQFSSFMENTPLLAWIIDEHGILHYMNSKYRESCNFPEDCLGKDIHDLYPQEIREKARQSVKEVLAGNKNLEYQYSYTDATGRKRTFSTCKFPITASDGKRYVGGQSIEITNELNTSEQLREANERFEYAGKATRDVIWDWDIATNKIQRFGGYNFIFGHEMIDDLIEFNTNNLHPDDSATVAESWQKAINSNASRWQNEFRYRCADGTYKNVIDQAYIIRDENGNAVRMIGSMQDVTEERRLQKEILENEVKKKSDVLNAVIEAQEKERKEISSELHDNVNQLLAASILFLKTASKETGASELIEQSLDYINKAVAEIRSLSHSLNPGALRVNGLFFALSDLTRKITIPGKFEAYLKAGIAFNEEMINPSLKLSMYRIAQECVNNILKHSGADKVNITLDCEEGNVLMNITDNGKGFDVESSSKGIGLINIFNRVEVVGGQAQIISAPGQGCTIKVQLPTS